MMAHYVLMAGHLIEYTFFSLEKGIESENLDYYGIHKDEKTDF